MHLNGRSPRPTALVVDDDPRCRAMTAEVLEARGLDVVTQPDGYQALCTLVRHSRDIRLLVVDTDMPGVHGWEVIRFAKAKAPGMRVLRLGRANDGVPPPEYVQLRDVPALVKPFTPALLLRAVGRQLRVPRVPRRKRRRGA